MNTREQMERLVRDHVEAGGDPFTPPQGISRADMNWVGWGLNAALAVACERAAAKLQGFPVTAHPDLQKARLTHPAPGARADE